MPRSHAHASGTKGLPAALRFDPSSGAELRKQDRGEHCCTHWGQLRNKHKVRVCAGVCYTPRACDKTGDGFYPFRDKEEKEFFRRFVTSLRELKALRDTETDRCMVQKAPNHRPPNRWNTSTPFPFAGELPDPGCGLLSGSGGAGAFQTLYIVPEAKLAFCGIPKAGISNWKQFFRFVMGAHDYASFPHGKPDLEAWSFARLHPEVRERIWNDPEWTFAAILRNPAERALSAYLDKLKVAAGSGAFARQHGFNETFTFDVFLERLEMELPGELSCKDERVYDVTGLSWCTDPHWRPQVWGCGMSEKIDRFDFIGSMDHAEEHTRALLETVGLWESHGKHFRNGRSRITARWDPCMQLFPLQDEFEETPLSSRHVGFQKTIPGGGTIRRKTRKGAKSQLSWDAIGHARKAGEKTNEYYTPELQRKVEENLYADDYQIWNLLEQANGGWVSGKDILPHLLNNNPVNQDNEEEEEEEEEENESAE